MPTQTCDAKANIRGYRTRVRDTFTRANSNSALGTADTGQTWAQETGFSGIYGISAHRPWAVSGAANDAGSTLLHQLLNGYIVQANVRVDPAARFGLIWRSNGALTPGGQKFYAELYFSSGVSRLIVVRQVSAVLTTLYDQPTVPALSPDETVLLKVQVIGNLHRLWIGDTLQTEISDSTHPANVRGGIVIGSNTYSGLDNFEVQEWGSTHTCTAKASILNTVEQTVTAKAAIHNTVEQTCEALAAITDQTLQQCAAKAFILDHVFAEVLDDLILETDDAPPEREVYEDADAFSVQREQGGSEEVVIWELATQFNSATSGTVRAKASIRKKTTQTATARAFITQRIQQFCTAKASIRPRFLKTVSARAKIFGRTSRTVEARASIDNRVERTCTARARIRRAQFQCTAKARIYVATGNEKFCSAKASITPQQLQKVDAKAAIRKTIAQTCSARAHIHVVTDAFVRARIRAYITTSLEVEYFVRQAIDERLAVNYNVSGGTRQLQFSTAQARIRKGVEARLTVTYSVAYNMPDGCVVRPTQRLQTRAARVCYARARIIRP